MTFSRKKLKKKKTTIFLTQLKFSELILAGSLAGFLQYTIAYPMEVIRTRMTMGRAYGNEMYRGILHCFSKTFKHEGIRGLYKGIGITLCSGVPYVALQMSLYQIYQNVIFGTLQNFEKNNLIIKLLCGSLTGMTAQAVVFPGDTLKRRMQTNGIGGEKKKYKNTWDAAKSIWKNEGRLRGFYKGLGPCMIKSIPSAAIQFASYDFFKSLFGI